MRLTHLDPVSGQTQSDPLLLSLSLDRDALSQRHVDRLPPSPCRPSRPALLESMCASRRWRSRGSPNKPTVVPGGAPVGWADALRVVPVARRLVERQAQGVGMGRTYCLESSYECSTARTMGGETLTWSGRGTTNCFDRQKKFFMVFVKKITRLLFFV